MGPPGAAALLGTPVFILLLYISPAKHWIQQSRTAGHQQEELRQLTENRALNKRVKALGDPGRSSARHAGSAWSGRASART